MGQQAEPHVPEDNTIGRDAVPCRSGDAPRAGLRASRQGQRGQLGEVPRTPSPWRGRSELLSLDHGSWEARKIPPEQKCFFLTSPFIELIGTWEQCAEIKAKIESHVRAAHHLCPE
jgi:hypothetical protein